MTDAISVLLWIIVVLLVLGLVFYLLWYFLWRTPSPPTPTPTPIPIPPFPVPVPFPPTLAAQNAQNNANMANASAISQPLWDLHKQTQEEVAFWSLNRDAASTIRNKPALPPSLYMAPNN